jgi:hypothetical protein
MGPIRGFLPPLRFLLAIGLLNFTRVGVAGWLVPPATGEIIVEGFGLINEEEGTVSAGLVHSQLPRCGNPGSQLQRSFAWTCSPVLSLLYSHYS